MAEDIKVTFIVPKTCQSEDDCTDSELKLAYTVCQHHCGGGLQAQWVHETKWNKFDGLTKKDVFVLSEFDGDLYERLRTTKCLLVGPRCLSCCLTEGVPIPSGPEPVFTVAMRGLVVTASGLSKKQKETIKRKVHWMGGIYSAVLTDDTTHLVADTVLSDKYIKSAEKGIPIMAESWVQGVWEASLSANVTGSSPDFNHHRLPPFANLQVTTSGITKRDKQMIMKLVNEHGGTFSGAFQSETTDVVVLTKEGVGSEKYKAALEYGKACVVPSWVKESAARGVAQPVSRYSAAGASTSSPLAEHRLPDMSLNFSRITNLRPASNFVDESKAIDITSLSGKMKMSQESKRASDQSDLDKEIQTEFENFDMSILKKVGPIFDGFCFWVTGLEGAAAERAAACVSRGGGVRLAAAGARVTHVLAPPAAARAAARALPAAPLLSPLWLLRSLRAGRPLDETPFLIDLKATTPVKSKCKPAAEPESPMSRRNLQLLRRPGLLPGPSPCTPEPLPDIPPEDDLVNHYLSQNIEPEPPRMKTPEPVPEVTTRVEQPDITEDVTEDPTEEIEQIFAGMTIEVQALDEEAVVEVSAEVGAAGGVLCAAGAGAGAGAGATHVLVPLDFDPSHLRTPTAEAVTVFWIKDCLSQQELLPIQYYHRPVNLPQWSGPPPLQGVVASLSTYSGVERAFLDELAKLLGATMQLRFCRRNTANALASTHLICPTPAGDKYAGAVKWGLPAVRGDWLLAVARAARRLPERGHLVGDTQPPSSPEKKMEEAAVEITGEEPGVLDKENLMQPPAGVPSRRGSLPGREDTPKTKVPVDEMSPASRYIAMARQGLLGGDTQDTPKQLLEHNGHNNEEEYAVRTPPLEEALSSPNLAALSPTTRRRLRALRCGDAPSDPVRTPLDPFAQEPDTPDSAFGAALQAGTALSPAARKRLWALVQRLPAAHRAPPARAHTPLSEVRSRFLAQFSGADTPPAPAPAAPPRKLMLLPQEQAETPPAKMPKLSIDQSAGSGVNISDPDTTSKSAQSVNATSSPSSLPAAVDAQLQRLNAALTNRLSSQRARRTRDSASLAPAPEPEAGPESQPNTVGWDDTTPTSAPASASASATAAATVSESAPPQQEPPVPKIKRFMLSSNVDNREEIVEMIQYLGGEVSEGSELDEAATHLLCAAPGRSEKMLGSVAAGRWVLHPAYVPRSRAHGGFLPEEEFEWGNPRATCLPGVCGAERALAQAAHRWRAARAAGHAGPLGGVRALLHVPAARRRLLARLVLAGGGRAPALTPPYNDITEEITVCFADLKRYPLSARDAEWLVSHNIPVCAPVLLSAYLTDDPPPNPREHCLPEFRPK